MLEAAKVCKVNHYLTAKTVATWLIRDSFVHEVATVSHTPPETVP